MSQADPENRLDPPHLTGGVQRTRPRKTRARPQVGRSEIPAGYGRIVAAGFDTVEETFDLEIRPEFDQAAAAAKIRAGARSDDEGEPFEWGGEVFHVKSWGGRGGVRYIMQNDDLLIRVRTPGQPWPLSVRYLAGGLWEHGADAMRARALEFLWSVASPRKGPVYGLWDRTRIKDAVKRIDWAVDIFSPALTREMTWDILRGGSVVTPPGVKRFPVGTGERLETLTLGSKSGLQVQLYDKGKEISDLSGKTWMFDLWRSNGWPGPDKEGKARDVWRIECRFSKEFLRERGLSLFDLAREELQKLVTEALYCYRLTVPADGDSNRRRWKMHPAWSMAAEKFACSEMLPLGRQITTRREALSKMLASQAVGVLRAREVLEGREFQGDDIPAIAGDVSRRLVGAVGNRDAVDDLKDRYQFIDEAR